MADAVTVQGDMTRTLAIGDIHGCLSALDALLEVVRPTAHDHLVFLGDYVDRGPDSRGVLDRVIALHRTGQVTCLRGNHEVMMQAAAEGWDDLRFWLHWGGVAALDSYRTESSDSHVLDIVPYEHWHFLKHTCVDWYETETHVFVHANLLADKPLAEQPTDWLHWQFLEPSKRRPHMSGKTMMCGHSEQRDGHPLQLERAVCIDTWAYGDGWLTCLDVESGEYWQANQGGATRVGWLT